MKLGKTCRGKKVLVLVVLGAWLLASLATSLWAQETKTPATTPPTSTPPETTKTPAERTIPTSKRKILGASLLIGRSLYAFEEMGSSGKSCKSCHKQGQDTKGQPWKQKKDETYRDGKMSLVKAINFCITSHQGGTALPTGGSEMKSLLLYVSSLQK